MSDGFWSRACLEKLIDALELIATHQLWVPVTEEECRLVRTSLEELLLHPLFAHSRRVPAFLRCVVNATLAGDDVSTLKERTIGVAAFHRQPDYDTNADPVVRITAGEVRKKLAQYYYAEGQEALVRFELPPGGYLPRFRYLAAGPVSLGSSRVVPQAEPVLKEAEASFARPEPVQSDEGIPTFEVSPVPVEPTAAALSRWLWLGLGFLGGIILLASVFVARSLARPSASDAFWEALREGDHPVLIVLPTIPRPTLDGVPTPYRFEGQSTAIEDASVAARITGQLSALKIPSSLTISNNLSLSDLRSGPAVLVGALDNSWSMRSSAALPFPFERSDDRRFGRIVNTLDPKRSYWATDFAIPNLKITKDYGVVARYHDGLTDRPMMLLAGISAQGTFAAGEAVTTPEYLKLFLDAGATGSNNFEAVIETQTVDGKSGPPKIVAFKTW